MFGIRNPKDVVAICVSVLLCTILLLTQSMAGQREVNASHMKKLRLEADRGNWKKAKQEALKMSDDAALVVHEWLRLRMSDCHWEDYLRFLRRHGNWPGLKLLRRVGEETIPWDARSDDVLWYFDIQKPQTGRGSLIYALALRKAGNRSLAEREIKRGWLAFPIDRESHERALEAFGSVLKPYHVTRLDRLLWDGENASARMMFPLVGRDYRKLAEARMALRANEQQTKAIIAKVPGSLIGDPGLAFERFLWRKRNGLTDRAVSLLVHRSQSEESLGRPDYWTRERVRLATAEFRNRNPKRAYDIASSHHLEKDEDEYGRLEWLSGYVALRMLDKPWLAVLHFERFQESIASPISLARAGYWLGRAHQAMGDKQEALKAYRRAAQYQTTFYGQLAAEKVGAKPDSSLLGERTRPEWRQARFRQDSVVRAAFLYADSGNESYAAWFLAHRAETMDGREIAQLAQMATDMGSDFASIKVAKQGLKQGDRLIDFLFPLTGLEKLKLAVPPELAISVVRQESEFRSASESDVGAVGLMQLMPATARDVAKELKLRGPIERHLLDSQTNVRLGSRYLRNKIDQFSGSLVLALAAYNAGAGRVGSWLDRIGDPRKSSVDPVDWIEHIPYDETRNYVMRVMEAVTVYRMRISSRVQPIELARAINRVS